jgi:hypothetical protein
MSLDYLKIGKNIGKLALIGAGAYVTHRVLEGVGDAVEVAVTHTPAARTFLNPLITNSGNFVKDLAPWVITYFSSRKAFNSGDSIDNIFKYGTQAVSAYMGAIEVGKTLDEVTPNTGRIADTYYVLKNKVGPYLKFASLAIPFIDPKN